MLFLFIALCVLRANAVVVPVAIVVVTGIMAVIEVAWKVAKELYLISGGGNSDK